MIPQMNRLERMNYRELSQLEAQVSTAKARKREEARRDVKGKVESLVRENGFSVTELFGLGGGERVKRVVPVKFRDPQSGKTWTGRGRRPSWVAENMRV